MFGPDDLKKVVECAGQALRAEDDYVTQCAKDHGWNDGPMGIRANTNERYYQFLIWRALMKSFPWRSQTEGLDRNDLVFWDGAQLVARAEIKGWWSTDGKQEIPGIRGDILKLKAYREPGAMLILTQNPKGLTARNLRFLAERLSVNPDEFVTYTFDTAPWYKDKGTPAEFVVVGFLAAGSKLVA